MLILLFLLILYWLLFGRQNRKKEFRMAVAKRQRSEKPTKTEQREVPRIGMRTTGRTSRTPGQPDLHRAGPGGGEKNIRRGAKGQVSLCLSLSCSLSLSLSFFSSHLLDRHALTPRGCIFLYFLNKTELEQGALHLICPRAVTRSVPGL